MVFKIDGNILIKYTLYVRSKTLEGITVPFSVLQIKTRSLLSLSLVIRHGLS